MSLQIDYAEISRHARRIVDANRAQAVLEQVLSSANGTNDNANSEEGSTSQPKKIRYTRSTKGCMGCRKHKVKCDETLPACLRCVASQRECDYSSNQTQGRKRRSATARKRSESDSVPPHTATAVKDDETQPVAPMETSRADIGPSNYIDPAMAAHITGAGAMSMISGRPSAGWDGWKTSPVSQTNGPGSWIPESLSGISNVGTTHIFADVVDKSRHELFERHLLIHTSSYPTTSRNISLTSLTGKFPRRNTGANIALRALAAIRQSGQIPPDGAAYCKVVDFSTSSFTTASTYYRAPPTFTHRDDIEVSPIVISAETSASEFDESLFEFGPSGRSGQSTRHGGTDILSNGFPSVPARTLFHHYCNVSSRFLVTMGNIGPNPLVTLCTPNKLLDTTSAASAAIRMSILSISIAHFTYETVDVVGATNLGPRWPETRAKLVAVGKKFKKAALSNIFLAETTETSADHVDSILAACTFICIRDVISADHTWSDNMEFVLKLAHKRGGPQAMLKDSPSGANFTRRYLLENLATHDVFSKEPALLGNYDCWWFESVETSQTRWEWESVERTFGISRAMVDLVARVLTLNSRKRRLGIVMSDNLNENEMMVIGQHFVRESHCLLLEADIWGNSLSALPQHYRVTCGDYIYKYMTVVIILADILEQPVSTPRIAKSVESILELCSEATAMRMSVMLTWPLLIAGLYCVPEVREKVSSLFDAFQYDYCEDLRTARALLQEQWRLIDAGEGRKSWREVMKKLGKHAMLI